MRSRRGCDVLRVLHRDAGAPRHKHPDDLVAVGGQLVEGGLQRAGGHGRGRGPAGPPVSQLLKQGLGGHFNPLLMGAALQDQAQGQNMKPQLRNDAGIEIMTGIGHNMNGHNTLFV